MRRLQPLVLILFLIGVCFVAAEPESALAHTKVHAGALALPDTAKLDDAPTAPSPVQLTVVLAVVALVVAASLTHHHAPVVARRRRDTAPPPDAAPRRASATRGPPVTI